MKKDCKQCGGGFEVTEDDLEFLGMVSPSYDGRKFDIPAPTFCPDCRHQRRISWRNERSLFKRECSSTGKSIISMYDSDVKFPVYDNDVWWGDSWDAKDYGRDFDFSRPFFEQMKELHYKVPHFALAVAKTTMENSDYCNHAGYLKNCYLVYNTDYAERCMYGKGVNRSYDCLDCFKVYESEACYESANCYNCKFSSHLWDSYNSSECYFSFNLIGCQNCFMCVNLQNQQYCFKNEKLSKEAWEKKVKEAWSKSNEDRQKEFWEFKSNFPVKRMNEKNTENCTGDYLVNCKNCHDCYDCEYLENCRYCYDLKKGDGVSYENYDISAFGVGVVRCYEGGTIGYNANHCLFGENVWGSNDVHYSLMCVANCKDCFGCVGMKKAQYCILNKQYSKEEYEKTVGRIIEHMKKTGEWGEFFPTEMSPFGYDETNAMEYFPMTKNEVVAKGWKWKGKERNLNFKILPLEKEFYEKWKIQVPTLHPDERHLRRLKYRNPRRLWDRGCGKCGVGIQTTYSSERREKVLCEKCYLEEVY